MQTAGRPADHTSNALPPLDESSNLDHSLTLPPSSYASSARRAKKRSSEEFEIDQFGVLVSKHPSSNDDDKSLGRKHRSLNMSISTSSSSRDSRTKDRKRSSAGLSPPASAKVSVTSPRAVDRHARQVSAGSMTASFNESHVPRRGLSNDFSHSTPAQSTTLAQPYLSPDSITKSSSHSHSAVAHSVLRGPQEGWSELDDEATAEALRKLDGLSGKTARARASFSSLGRHSNSSRPPTPAGKTAGQWEGIHPVEHSKTKRGTKESGNVRDKDRDSLRLTSGGVQKGSVPDYHTNVASSDDQHSSSAAYEKSPKKMVSAATRSSFTPKRGSTSSTNYASTPTTSSRDSATVSVSTGLTSMSANSGRYSTGKARRDSTGSDSVHFSETSSIKERNMSVTNGDFGDDDTVPPVPPLPKDLSNYRSPPQSALPSQALAPTSEDPSAQVGATGKEYSPLVADAPVAQNPQANATSSQSRRQSQYVLSGPTSAHSAPESSPSVPKTPSKKWSFSALNLKLSSSPASTSKTPFPLSPRSVAFGSRPKSSSRDRGGHSPGQRRPWSPEQPGAMDSEGSLASMSSAQNPSLKMYPSKTPDAIIIPSRSSTASSASTNNTTSGLAAPHSGPLSPASPIHRNQSKRLTPSSIPFFRRSSSQSMQVPSSFIMSSSPTFSSSGVQTPSNRKTTSSPPGERQQATVSAPSSTQKKSSVLSLGFPSLLKSSSRRSLHSDSKDSGKEQKAKDILKEEKKQKKDEKDKQKKDEKDRSESRISLLMGGGRRRGKVRSFHWTGLLLTLLIDAFVCGTSKTQVTSQSTPYAGACSRTNHYPALGKAQAWYYNCRCNAHGFQVYFFIESNGANCQLDAKAVRCFSSIPKPIAHHSWLAVRWNEQFPDLKGSVRGVYQFQSHKGDANQDTSNIKPNLDRSIATSKALIIIHGESPYQCAY